MWKQSLVRKSLQTFILQYYSCTLLGDWQDRGGGCDADLSCSFSLLFLLRVFTQLLRSFHPSRVLKVTPCTPSSIFSRVSEKWFVLASSPYALKLTFPIWTSEMTSEVQIFELVGKLIVIVFKDQENFVYFQAVDSATTMLPCCAAEAFDKRPKVMLLSEIIPVLWLDDDKGGRRQSEQHTVVRFLSYDELSCVCRTTNSFPCCRRVSCSSSSINICTSVIIGSGVGMEVGNSRSTHFLWTR